MEVNVEETSALTRKVTVTLAVDVVKPQLDKAYDKLKRESKMKGFRRGKVPRSIIVKQFKPQVEGETSEKLVQDNYFTAIEKEGIDPVVHPDIKSVTYNDDGSFTFVVDVDIRPEFELGEYKGLEIEKVEILVTEEDVQREIEGLQKNMAALQSVSDREIQDGDVVIVDFQGYNDGKSMPEVKSENSSIDVGSGNMGKEFEEKLLGMKKDEEATHEIDFPESHPNPALKGKKVEFHITIKDVKERILAELDDEFAKDAGEEFKTLDDLKSSIRTRQTQEKEESSKGILTDRIMEKLLNSHGFEVPKRLVTFEVEQMIKQTEQQLEQGGMSLEAAGLSREKLAEQNQEMAVKRVRGDFVLKKIADVEEIKVADEDLDRGFQRIGDQYNMDVAKVKEYFQNRDDLLPFMNELLNEKILTFLRDEAVLVEAPVVEEKEAETTVES